MIMLLGCILYKFALAAVPLRFPESVLTRALHTVCRHMWLPRVLIAPRPQTLKPQISVYGLRQRARAAASCCCPGPFSAAEAAWFTPRPQTLKPQISVYGLHPDLYHASCIILMRTHALMHAQLHTDVHA